VEPPRPHPGASPLKSSGSQKTPPVAEPAPLAASATDPYAAAIAFTAAATAATAVARLAHQLHGAIGVTAEYSLHRWTTRIWSARDWPRPQAEWIATLGCTQTEEQAWHLTAFDHP
jgi:Acyl-CoA dehydrogenase, C-terminal domain